MSEKLPLPAPGVEDDPLMLWSPREAAHDMENGHVFLSEAAPFIDAPLKADFEIDIPRERILDILPEKNMDRETEEPVFCPRP